MSIRGGVTDKVPLSEQRQAEISLAAHMLSFVMSLRSAFIPTSEEPDSLCSPLQSQLSSKQACDNISSVAFDTKKVVKGVRLTTALTQSEQRRPVKLVLLAS